MLAGGLNFRELLRTVPQFEPSPVSHCSCALEAGCWGSEGWHFAPHGIESLVRMEKRRFAEQRPGWSQEALRRAWGQWLVREHEEGRLDDEGMHLAWKPYAGLPYAFEVCQGFLRNYRIYLESKQADRSVERKKSYEDSRPNISFSKRERR